MNVIIHIKFISTVPTKMYPVRIKTNFYYHYIMCQSLFYYPSEVSLLKELIILQGKQMKKQANQIYFCVHHDGDNYRNKRHVILILMVKKLYVLANTWRMKNSHPGQMENHIFFWLGSPFPLMKYPSTKVPFIWAFMTHILTSVMWSCDPNFYEFLPPNFEICHQKAVKEIIFPVVGTLWKYNID